MDLKGVLFDLDGVLIDSEGTYTEFWAGVDRKYPTGIPNFAYAIKGTTLPQILLNFPDEAVRQEIVAGLIEFQNNMTFPLYADTLEFLDMLSAAGLKMAIVTSSDSKKMDALYRQHPSFRSHFDAVIDASLVHKSKPDPEGYLKTAAALGLEPRQCVVFEDSLQGLKAGRASGAKVVAMATTYPAERLQGMADIIAGRLRDVTLEMLRNL